MVADALKDTSRAGGLVLDAFCGSGTILIAAQKTGRRARAIEIDPLYCDIAIRRWQTFAKDDAILAETGETFDEVAARRSHENASLRARGVSTGARLMARNRGAKPNPSPTRSATASRRPTPGSARANPATLKARRRGKRA
jgi:hypothetical protein